MIFNQRVVQLTGRRIALTPPVNFTATPGNEQVSLTWEDPGDATSGGVVVAEWEFTQIVRKVGSPPVNQTDGTIVTISDVKNQHLSEPFVDTGLTNGTTYYYGAFACSKAGAWSDGAFAGAIPVAGTALGSFAEGTLVKIKENGTPVEFYVAKQGYEPTLNGPNRVLMVRKDVYDQRAWNSSNVNAWATSTMLSWLNGDYKGLFSSVVQNLMGVTSYYYTPGYGNYTVSNKSDSVFLMSLTELGRSYAYANVEGTILPISLTLQIAYQDGSATTQWTRSPSTGDSSYAWELLSNGDPSNPFCTALNGSRPCFTLPKNALVDPDMNLIESSDIPPIETPLGDLVEGTLITIQESGAPVEFYVAKQNYEEELNGPGRVLVVRKDGYDERKWSNSTVNAWANSSIRSWLNSSYKDLLSSAVQELIGQTTYYYTDNGTDENVLTRSDSVFLLSATELNKGYNMINREGSPLPIYETLEIANYNGSPVPQWTRSPYLYDSQQVVCITKTGAWSHTNPTFATSCSRPVFTLPASALVDGNLALIEEV